MDRVFTLKKTEANSVLSNTSISSELGYETANDDSFSSLYYSINDDTLTNDNVDDIDESANSPSQRETVIDLCASSFSPVNPTKESSISSTQTIVSEPIHSTDNTDSDVQPFETVSTAQTVSSEPIHTINESFQQTIPLLPIDYVDNEIVAMAEVLPMNQECLDDELNKLRQDVAADIHNMIPNFPTEALSSNFACSSTMVQELYVVEVTQPQQQKKEPEIKRALRRTTVRFQTDDLRRNEMRRTIMPLSRRTQVGSSTDSKAISRRTLLEVNVQPKPASSHSNNFVCDVCKKSFPLRSTLNVHRSSHANSTVCKYCDRTFKKHLALSIHLKENCEKIPSAVRRKILTKEFNNISAKV